METTASSIPRIINGEGISVKNANPNAAAAIGSPHAASSEPVPASPFVTATV